jgi:hypothetical protein
LRTLILSHYLAKHSDFVVGDVDVHEWTSRSPSPASYHATVLDMKIADAGQHDHGNYPFYGAREDLERAVKSGAVVICLDDLTYVNPYCAFQGPRRDVQATQHLKATFTYPSKHQGMEETSYDWLDQGFLGTTRLDTMDSRPSPSGQLQLASGPEQIRSYLRLVKRFYKVIYGVELDRTGRSGTIRYQRQDAPSAAGCSEVTATVSVLAFNAVTGDPVAAEIRHPDAPGCLVFLPRFEEPSGEQAQTARQFIVLALRRVAEWFHQRNRQEAGIKQEAPEWAKGHRSGKAEELDARVERLDTERKELAGEREKYDEMLVLLYGTGEPLRLAVEKLFGSEWMGFKVDVAGKGESIDQFIWDSASARSLAMEVTGLSGKFDKDNNHLADVLHYLPIHFEKNAGERVEQIVLAANTHRDTPLADRHHEDDFTPPVKEMAAKNGFCLIRTCDLYRLWLDYLEGTRTAGEIFDSIFCCAGLYQYPPPTKTS